MREFDEDKLGLLLKQTGGMVSANSNCFSNMSRKSREDVATNEKAQRFLQERDPQS